MVTKNTQGVRAVIFDISGTVLDYGSRGPVAAFIELFARHRIMLSADEARRPMGTHKKDHIRALLAEPSIAMQWEKENGHKPASEFLDQLYAEFGPLQKEVLQHHCDIIPGVPELVKDLRARGIKIANTTGFDSAMISDLKRLAGEHGYTPDLWVCPDQVGKGRPAPWMAFHIARQLELYPMSSFVKVGDTPADVAEAQAAGMWAVSVIQCGNEVGLSRAELATLPMSDRMAKFSAARARLAACGPHFLIDTTADLLPVIDEISARIVRGERP